MNSAHQLSKESGGEGNMAWVRAVCSCGWKGGQYYAYDDHQYRSITRDEDYHMRQVREAETTSPTTQP